MKMQKRIPGEPITFPRDFLGIEDVENPTFEYEVIEGGEVLSGVVRVVLAPSEDDEKIIDGGQISMHNRLLSQSCGFGSHGIVADPTPFVVTRNPVLLLSSFAVTGVPLL